MLSTADRTQHTTGSWGKIYGQEEKILLSEFIDVTDQHAHDVESNVPLLKKEDSKSTNVFKRILSCCCFQ